MLDPQAPTWPQSWTLELIRNPSGRAFWFVSRFVSPTRVEYIEDVAGMPKCFRLEGEALAAAATRNAAPKAET